METKVSHLQLESTGQSGNGFLGVLELHQNYHVRSHETANLKI